jgi:lysophospholipase L1-like esterase
MAVYNDLEYSEKIKIYDKGVSVNRSPWPASQSDPTMRFLRFLQLAWQNICILFALLIATELLAMLYYQVRYGMVTQAPKPFVGRVPETYPAGSVEARSFGEAGRIDPYWVPYVYWRMSPFQGRYVTVDASGRRHTWSSRKPNEATIEPRVKVFVFGGSTVWGLGASDEQTIPSHLAKILDRRFSKQVEVLNYGQIGYVSTQEVINLIRELQSALRPDIVVFYDGFNDTWFPLAEGAAGVTMGETNRYQEFNLLSPMQSPRLYSEIMKRRYTYLALQNLRRRIRPPTTSVAMGPDVVNSLASEIVRTYTVNVRTVQVLAKEFGFRPVFYWQPVVYSKKSKSAAEKKWADLSEKCKSLFQATYDRIKEAPCTNISDLFDDATETVFFDSCHVSEPTNELIAQRVAKDVVPLVNERLGQPARQ